MSIVVSDDDRLICLFDMIINMYNHIRLGLRHCMDDLDTIDDMGLKKMILCVWGPLGLAANTEYEWMENDHERVFFERVLDLHETMRKMTYLRMRAKLSAMEILVVSLDSFNKRWKLFSLRRKLGQIDMKKVVQKIRADLTFAKIFESYRDIRD